MKRMNVKGNGRPEQLELQNIKAPLCGNHMRAGRALDLNFVYENLVARLSPQSLDLVFQLQLLLFQPPDLYVVNSGLGSCFTDPFFQRPVLFCEFCKMSRNCHQLPPKEIADIEIVPHV